MDLITFKEAAGVGWEKIALRAMLRAEQVMKRRLKADDVFARTDDHSFVIGFKSKDTDRNEEVLARIVRGLRLCFLDEFGNQVAKQVPACLAPDVATTAPLLPERVPMAVLSSLHQVRRAKNDAGSE